MQMFIINIKDKEFSIDWKRESKDYGIVSLIHNDIILEKYECDDNMCEATFNTIRNTLKHVKRMLEHDGKIMRRE